MSVARRSGSQRFLEVADSMRLDIRRFAERVIPPDGGGGAAAAPVEAQGTDAELYLAVEELRAQNDALAEACARLERETAKYRDLYESSPDALVTTDARGVIEDANAATAMLLQMPQPALPGMLLVAFVARRDTRPFRDNLRAIADGPGEGIFRVHIRPRGRLPVLVQLFTRAVRVRTAHARAGGPSACAFHWTIRVVEAVPDASEQPPSAG